MKKAWMIILSFLAGAFLIAACGYGGEGAQDGGADGQDGNGGDQQKNECERAADVYMQGFDQACASRGTICCYCKCWNDGHKTYDAELYASNQTCLCEEPQTIPPPACEGQTLNDALACLANETACKEQAQDLITNAQYGACTLTPL